MKPEILNDFHIPWYAWKRNPPWCVAVPGNQKWSRVLLAWLSGQQPRRWHAAPAQRLRQPQAATIPLPSGEWQTSPCTAKLSFLFRLPGVGIQKCTLDTCICPIPIGFENLTVL